MLINMEHGKELNRHQDNIHRAYCSFMLIKKKCDYNIYEKVDDLLDDVLGANKEAITVEEKSVSVFGELKRRQLSVQN